MPTVLSRPDTSKLTVQVICSPKNRARADTRDGCLAHLVFFAADIKYEDLGSEDDTTDTHFFTAICPDCGMKILFRPNEISAEMQSVIRDGRAAKPNEDLAYYFTDWNTAVKCGRENCGRHFVVKAGDIHYGDFTHFDDHTRRFYATCHCGRDNILEESILPEFVKVGAKLRYEVTK